jgi:hypothetical protein
MRFSLWGPICNSKVGYDHGCISSKLDIILEIRLHWATEDLHTQLYIRHLKKAASRACLWSCGLTAVQQKNGCLLFFMLKMHGKLCVGVGSLLTRFKSLCRQSHNHQMGLKLNSRKRLSNCWDAKYCTSTQEIRYIHLHVNASAVQITFLTEFDKIYPATRRCLARLEPG